MSLLTIDNLSIGYDNQVILKDLSFKVEDKDYLCIIGENGAGKTTLMRTLLNLQDPIKGKIILSNELKRTEIGYLPQQNNIQKDFPASVEEVVLSGCQNKTLFYKEAEKNLAKTNMEKMGITDLAKRCYRELSGGQQQRVLLARALCATKKLLLLDEPVSGLDPQVTKEMYQIISNLNKEGITIIMISHDMDALNYANKVLYIGKDVFFGTKDEYFRREKKND